MIYSKKILPKVIIACILMSTQCMCSSKNYQASNNNKVEIKTNNRELKKFMEQGFEKQLNTKGVNANDIIKTAYKYLGVPHCMGGTTFKCMDCSGLLYTCFKTHGINLPHSSEQQARYGKYIADRSLLKRGDLVFFIRTYNTNKYITHSGIYLGNNEFIHTSSSKGVTINSINNSWWSERFIFGTRIFK